MSQGFKPLWLEEHCCHALMYSFGKHYLSIQWALRWIVQKYLSLETHNQLGDKCTLNSQVKCKSVFRDEQMLLVAVWRNHREKSEKGLVALQGGPQNNTWSINRGTRIFDTIQVWDADKDLLLHYILMVGLGKGCQISALKIQHMQSLLGKRRGWVGHQRKVEFRYWWMLLLESNKKGQTLNS